MSTKISIGLFSVLLMVFFAITGSISMAQSTKILFSRNPLGDSNKDIYMMSLTDLSPRLIRSAPGTAREMQFSDDGSKITFSSNGSTTGQYEVFLMNADGSGVSQLTANNDIYASDVPKFFSSTKIWFDRGPVAGVHEWWEMNYDGTGQIQKTNWQAAGKQSPRFNFTNDRQRVVYEKGDPSWAFSHEIYIANADLSDEHRLTSNGNYDGYPSWSPDGTKIIWHEETAPWTGIFNVWTINADGTNSTQVTNAGPGKKYWTPLFSPDGSKIICSYHDGVQWDIYSMDLDGTHQQNITNTPAFDELVTHAFFYDIEPPIISVTDPMTVFPPNHKYCTVAVKDFVISVTDQCAGILNIDDIKIIRVDSDEPENSTGDGNTSHDIVINAAGSAVDLRCERNGKGNGRVYIITVGAKDPSGNLGTATFEVSVPHDKKETAINDGVRYSVIGPTEVPLPTVASAKASVHQNMAAEIIEPRGHGYHLFPNYPNPFNPATIISYSIPIRGSVTLRVFDALGREVAELVNTEQEAGSYHVSFDGSALSSGVYFCQLRTGMHVQTTKLILSK